MRGSEENVRCLDVTPITTRGRPLKPRSVNKHVECVRGFLRYLCAEGLSPAGFVDAVQPVKEPHVLPGGVLSHEQVRCILDRIPSGTASGVRDRAMLEMLYSAGIRAAELLGLDVDRVDFRNGTALVTGKGNRQRVVPVGHTAMRLLESYVRAVRPYMLADRDEQALFVDGAGKRLAYHSLRRIVHRRAEAAGIEINVTPHTFRRSCATEMLRSGANMYHVKELLGHESLETLKHYAKLTITDLKKTHAKCHPRERDREQ